MIIKSIIKQFLLVVNVLVADSKFLGWACYLQFSVPCSQQSMKENDPFPNHPDNRIT